VDCSRVGWNDDGGFCRGDFSLGQEVNARGRVPLFAILNLSAHWVHPQGSMCLIASASASNRAWNFP
jgi:hypothetical protein